MSSELKIKKRTDGQNSHISAGSESHSDSNIHGTYQVTILNTITLITGNMNLVSTRPNKRYPCFNQKEKPYLNNSFAHACYQKKNRALQMSNSSCGKNQYQSRP